MSNRGALIVAAALTAFVLVVAGGIAGRLSKPATPVASSSATKVVASLSPERRPAPRPSMPTWRDDDEDDHDRGATHSRRESEAEAEGEDD